MWGKPTGPRVRLVTDKQGGDSFRITGPAVLPAIAPTLIGDTLARDLQLVVERRWRASRRAAPSSPVQFCEDLERALAFVVVERLAVTISASALCGGRNLRVPRRTVSGPPDNGGTQCVGEMAGRRDRVPGSRNRPTGGVPGRLADPVVQRGLLQYENKNLPPPPPPGRFRGNDLRPRS